MSQHGKKGKHQVTFTFETEEILEDFLGWFADGGGEQDWMRDGPPWPNFDYSRCFPAWGWKEETPRFIDCDIDDDDEIDEELEELDEEDD